ncbi:hypothetical protein ACSTAL_31650, partial [Streptomyces californicus]
GVDTGRPGAGASADGVVAAEMSDVPEVSDGTVPGAGALVVLSVERSTATALLGAGVSGRLAVAVSDER